MTARIETLFNNDILNIITMIFLAFSKQKSRNKTKPDNKNKTKMEGIFELVFALYTDGKSSSINYCTPCFFF